MKEGFKPKSFKNYNLTPEEQKELDKFLDKSLEKSIFDCFNHLKPHLSPLSKRKMGDFNHAKITGTWMIGWLKMHILYL
jgi:hypothetical protein